MTQLARALTFAVLLATGAVLRSQDTVTLDDGTRIRGEIQVETTSIVTIITRMGRMRVVPRGNVAKLRRGKPLSKRTQKRLATADASDPDQLFAVARWALRQGSLTRDAKRIARRVLALDGDHAAARELLGHVQLMGRWFRDPETAMRTIKREMKAKGLVAWKGGFCRKEEMESIEESPARWMIAEDMRWRLVELVMKERGMIRFEGQWYPPEHRHMIDELKVLKQRQRVPFQAAREGVCEVYCFLGREQAQRQAARLQRTREWFEATFDAGERAFTTQPVSRSYVLADQPQLARFARQFKDRHGLSDETIKFHLSCDLIIWDPIDAAIHVKRGEGNWEASLVSDMGARLMHLYWHGGFRLPDWLWIASAHHAEVAVFGQAVIWFVARDKYDGISDRRVEAGRTLKGARRMLRDIFKRRRRPTSLRTLVNTKTNAMTMELDLYGTVLLDYMLQTHRAELLRYITGEPTTLVEERFKESFGRSYEEMEIEFKSWLLGE